VHSGREVVKLFCCGALAWYSDDGMNDDEITVVGQTHFRGQAQTFGIYGDDRRRHVYIIGKTGVGKTTLMENMIRQDIVNCLKPPIKRPIFGFVN